MLRLKDNNAAPIDWAHKNNPDHHCNVTMIRFFWLCSATFLETGPELKQQPDGKRADQRDAKV